jgi:hypothetical protein
VKNINRCVITAETKTLYVVIHVDGDEKNNCLRNLKVGSRSEVSRERQNKNEDVHVDRENKDVPNNRVCGVIQIIKTPGSDKVQEVVHPSIAHASRETGETEWCIRYP